MLRDDVKHKVHLSDETSVASAGNNDPIYILRKEMHDWRISGQLTDRFERDCRFTEDETEKSSVQENREAVVKDLSDPDILHELSSFTAIDHLTRRTEIPLQILYNSTSLIFRMRYFSRIGALIVRNVGKSSRSRLRNVSRVHKIRTNSKKYIKVHKDVYPQTSKNNVVYKISCNDCDATYVGQTGRKLKTRIAEHRNHIRYNTSARSVITEHRRQLDHEFKWDEVEILDEEPCYRRRLVSEMINIKKQKNGLNLQTDTDGLHKAYIPIINRV
ncbi:hypothetical protein ALC56_08798 [Trachymyrmex septentrionalis]|uniref:GIY-YIG domain-containing protein n=1 Tax=Trachymyrmex septentrionalis TaxID=34720 RepID=A0A195F9W6_9HYME|nr:hypothetical protein ALC56_08798 [Trachymyrmex septentrionalis]